MFIFIGKQDYSNDIPDNERFASEFKMVEKDNVFKYVNIRDVHMIASGKKGIVLFGVGNNEWVEYYASIVNEVAKETGVKEIYYYDFSRDREQNNATYEDTIKLLNKYVIYNDLNKADFYAPTLLVVSGDEVLLFDTETNFIKGHTNASVYWNEYNRGLKYNQLKTVFMDYLER